jgi:hypothetical protein
VFEAEDDRLMNRVSESALILHFAARPQTPTDRAKNLDFAEKSARQAKS